MKNHFFFNLYKNFFFFRKNKKKNKNLFEREIFLKKNHF